MCERPIFHYSFPIIMSQTLYINDTDNYRVESFVSRKDVICTEIEMRLHVHVYVCRYLK